MLKFGITTPAQLKSGLWRGRRAVAVSLYDQASGDDARQEEVLIRLSTGTGVCKRTYRNRFDGFDELVARAITEHLPADGECSIHDLGVSDGRTTYDLWRRVNEIGRAIRLVASDACPELTVISEPRGRLQVALDNTGTVVQVVWPPFVFNAPRRESSLYYPINTLVRYALFGHAVPRLVDRYRSGEPVDAHAVQLLHPHLRRLVDDGAIDFITYNVLDPMPQQFHVVRAMNVLNPGYFSPAEMRTAVGNIHASLADGGLFAVGRNQQAGSPTDGCIYVKRSGSFEELVRINGGSPIREAIASEAWR